MAEHNMAEQAPSFEDLPLEDLLNVHELIYHPQTLNVLVNHLENGVADEAILPDLCSAILRLYVLYPQCANAEVVRKILVQTLVALPENQFPFYAGMISQYFSKPEETKRVADIFKLQELLEGCQFKQAWALLREPDMVDVLHTPGLTEAIRRSACDVIALTFSTILLSDFCQMLNLGQSNSTAIDDRMDKILKARGWSLEDAGPGIKAVRITAATREVDSSRFTASRGSIAHKTVEKYLSVEGLRQSLSLLQSS